MNKFYPLALVCIIVISSCKSASKLYEKGNYKDAIEVSIKKLQKDPYDAESRSTLQKSYAYAVSEHEDKIRILSGSNNENKYEQIYQHYYQLQHLYETIRAYPTISNMVKPADYSSYVQTYKSKASEAHFERGMKWMEENTKRAYRDAYQEFRQALYYKPNDIDIQKKIEEAYDLALVKVMIVPMDAYNSDYYYSNNSYQMRNFQDELIRNLNYNSNNTFVKFFTNTEARSRKIEPDEILEMRLGRMNFGQAYDQSSSKQVSKEVVVKETVYRKDSVVKEYAKVYATVTTTRRTLVSDGDMYLTSRDNNNMVIWADNFKGEHRWQTDFATYTGDERALSDSDKALLNKKNNNNVPRQEEIVSYILNQIENNLSSRLRNYYNRYQ